MTSKLYISIEHSLLHIMNSLECVPMRLRLRIISFTEGNKVHIPRYARMPSKHLKSAGFDPNKHDYYLNFVPLAPISWMGARGRGNQQKISDWTMTNVMKWSTDLTLRHDVLTNASTWASICFISHTKCGQLLSDKHRTGIAFPDVRYLCYLIAFRTLIATIVQTTIFLQAVL